MFLTGRRCLNHGAGKLRVSVGNRATALDSRGGITREPEQG
jgi:hypothetical protein